VTASTIEIRLDLAFNEADICLPDAEAETQIRTMLGNGFGVAEPFGRFLGTLEVQTVPGSKVCAAVDVAGDRLLISGDPEFVAVLSANLEEVHEFEPLYLAPESAPMIFHG